MFATLLSATTSMSAVESINSDKLIEKTTSEPVLVVDNISTKPIFMEQKSLVEKVVIDTYLRYSGKVNISGHLSDIELKNSNGSLIISMQYNANVDSKDVDYFEVFKYEAMIKPYFNYKIDNLGLYPTGKIDFFSVSDNQFTETEISDRDLESIKNTITSAIKNSYIKGLTKEEVSSAERNIESSDFFLVEDDLNHKYLKLIFH
jgi:hypothetical protein